MIELIKVDGLPEIEKMLKQLPPNIEKKVLNQALMAGGKVIRDEARRLAPTAKEPHVLHFKKKFKGISKMVKDKGLGFLKKGIIISTGYSDINKYGSSDIKKMGTKGLLIGFSRKTWYGFLIERGWIASGRPKKGEKLYSRRKNIKSGSHGFKHIPGRPMLRPAFDNNATTVLELFKMKVSQFLNIEYKSMWRAS